MNHGCVVCEKSTEGSVLVTAEKSGGTRGPGKFAVAAGAQLLTAPGANHDIPHENLGRA